MMAMPHLQHHQQAAFVEATHRKLMLSNNAYDRLAQDDLRMTHLADQLESPLVVMVQVEANMCLIKSTPDHPCNIAMYRDSWHANCSECLISN